MYLKEDLRTWTTELERVEEYKTSLQHFLTGLPSSNVRKRTDDKWIELIDYSDNLVEYVVNRITTIQRELEIFENTINDLPQREQTVLRSRYLIGLQWKDIIKNLPLSERAVFNAHSSGISKLNMAKLDLIGTLQP